MRRSADPNTQSGFSLLELVIVIILVILLFLFAFDRLLPIRGNAEGAKVASVIGSLRSAVGLEVARRIVEGGASAIAELEGSNPMELLQERPDRYLGERSATPAEVAGGAWYFDPEQRALVYRVDYPQYLEGTPEGPVALRWRLQLVFENLDGRQGFDPGTDRLDGVRLAPLDAYRWPGLPRAGIARNASEPLPGPG